ncbi:CocE/NonD family hydrolase [Micromonospora sp. KC721]|uniref:CocE/NonD family hydrolase n=1 Tax=Micromonospora sp. KC721 TaxID=2530380 RepID=UPI001053F81F|nr:hypothetical protein E1182_25385 [Micromonospora sp. KC721]
MRHERADGLDTIASLADQPWYTGQLCVFGFSYCGYATWGFAADAGDQLVGLTMAATAAQFTGSLYTGGAFSLDSALTWVWGLGALGSDPERQPTLILRHPHIGQWGLSRSRRWTVCVPTCTPSIAATSASMMKRRPATSDSARDGRSGMSAS